MRDQLITRGASKSLLRVRASLHELGLDNSYSYDLGVLLSGPGICFRSDERIACAPRLCQLVRVRRREVIEPQMAVVSRQWWATAISPCLCGKYVESFPASPPQRLQYIADWLL